MNVREKQRYIPDIPSAVLSVTQSVVVSYAFFYTDSAGPDYIEQNCSRLGMYDFY